MQKVEWCYLRQKVNLLYLMASGWLHKLQESDQSAKKMYLIAGTIIMMTLIVSMWLAWFNPINLQTGAGTTNETANISQSGNQDFSLWQSVKSGFGSFGHIIMKPREYIVKPQN